MRKIHYFKDGISIEQDLSKIGSTKQGDMMASFVYTDNMTILISKEKAKDEDSVRYDIDILSTEGCKASIVFESLKEARDAFQEIKLKYLEWRGSR